MNLLHEICSIPTAPFVEQRVVQYVETFAKQRKLKLSKDRFGNLLIELKGTNSRAGRWVFTAHMDHPGFIAAEMTDANTLRSDFRGYVLAKYMAGQKVIFFDGNQQITGKVVKATAAKDSPKAISAEIKISKAVTKNSPGMFDLVPAKTKGKLFHSRAIDDLAGAAAALEMINLLYKKKTKTSVAVLLTRGEEEGFIGAIAASKYPTLLKKSDRLIAIECSAKQPYAKQGDGCIIRIGDRTSVFNSSISYFITDIAAELAKKDKTFKVQRALMPGGTCEATVYDVYGFTAGSICVPLGNYHNMDRERKKIGPEYIDVNDWQNMVKLFVAIAKSGHTYEPGLQQLKDKIEKRFEMLRHLF